MLIMETGVRQWCFMSPSLFVVLINFIVSKKMNGPNFGIKWINNTLADLDFADDIALFRHTLEILQEVTNNLYNNSAGIGLKIN